MKPLCRYGDEPNGLKFGMWATFHNIHHLSARQRNLKIWLTLVCSNWHLMKKCTFLRQFTIHLSLFGKQFKRPTIEKFLVFVKILKNSTWCTSQSVVWRPLLFKLLDWWLNLQPKLNTFIWTSFKHYNSMPSSWKLFLLWLSCKVVVTEQ